MIRVLVLIVSIAVACTTTAADEEVKVDIVSKPDTCDRAAQNGDTISMRYKGNLFDVATGKLGKQFDSNFDRPDTFDFKLGAGKVILVGTWGLLMRSFRTTLSYWAQNFWK